MHEVEIGRPLRHIRFYNVIRGHATNYMLQFIIFYDNLHKQGSPMKNYTFLNNGLDKTIMFVSKKQHGRVSIEYTMVA